MGSAEACSRLSFLVQSLLNSAALSLLESAPGTKKSHVITSIDSKEASPGAGRRVTLLRTAFGQLDEGVQRLIYRSRDPQLRATAGDVAIQRVNLRALPAI